MIVIVNYISLFVNQNLTYINFVVYFLGSIMLFFLLILLTMYCSECLIDFVMVWIIFIYINIMQNQTTIQYYCDKNWFDPHILRNFCLLKNLFHEIKICCFICKSYLLKKMTIVR